MINGVSARAGSDVDAIEPLDEQVDHFRGPSQARVILEYGDYECPYSRAAYRDWLSARRDDEAAAFVAYSTALDREEYVAAQYRRLIPSLAMEDD